VRTKFSIAAPVTLLILVFGTLLVRLPLAAAERANDYTLFDPVVDVEHLISRHFFRELSDEDLAAMQLGAINGMIEVLDDRYTQYIPARKLADFDKQVRGEYAGIGAEVITEDGWLKIVSPMEDSPAYRTGIQADDFVVAVDGTSTWQRNVNDVIKSLVGAPGTPVLLTIERTMNAGDPPPSAKDPSVPGELGDAPGPADDAQRFDLQVVRERIVAPTVKGVHRDAEKWSYWIDPASHIGYVRVTQFTDGTIPELETACRQLVADGLQGFILDLRFNGGGSLFAAIRMADLFLTNGKIVETRGRTGQGDRYIANERGTLPDFPMIVLANGQSASASEIVSGALQDNKRAAILGERTFGKGIVQSMYRLPSGAGQLKVTEQYYYLPSGRLLHRTDDSSEWGVDPNPGMYVPMTNQEYSQVFRIRQQEEIIRPNGDSDETVANWNDAQWILNHLKDKQLTAAVTAIRGKLDTGEWPAVGDDTNQGDAVKIAELQREQRRLQLIQRELLHTQRRIDALAAAEPDAHAAPPDLIPDERDLTGGTLRVLSADGQTIANLSITGPNLEAWLSGAPLKPESPVASKNSPESTKEN